MTITAAEAAADADAREKWARALNIRPEWAEEIAAATAAAPSLSDEQKHSVAVLLRLAPEQRRQAELNRRARLGLDASALARAADDDAQQRAAADEAAHVPAPPELSRPSPPTARRGDSDRRVGAPSR